MCPQLHDLETRYSIAPVYSLFALDASTGLPAKNPSLAYGAITPTTLGCKAVQEGHASIPHFNSKDIGQVANRYWTKGRDCLYIEVAIFNVAKT